MSATYDGRDEIEAFNRAMEANRPRNVVRHPAARERARQPGRAPTAEAPQRGTRIGKLLLRTPADAAAAPPRDYYLKGLISPGELSLWWGDGGAGKTFLLLYLAYMLALGRQVFGRRVKPVRVLYLGLEGEGGIEQRIDALRREYGDAEGFAYIAQPVNLFSDEAAIDDLKDAISQHGAGLVVIDTLNRAIGEGSESADSDMGRLRGTFDAIRYETGAHVAVVHHGGKDEARGPRGHSGLLFATDLTVKLVEGEGGNRTATVTRVKEGEAGAVFGYTIRKVQLGIDADGDPIETGIAKEAEAAPEAVRDKRHTLTVEEAGWLGDIVDLFAMPDIAREVRPEPDMQPVRAATRGQIRAWLQDRRRFSVAPGVALTATDRSDFRRFLNRLKDKKKLVVLRDLVWQL